MRPVRWLRRGAALIGLGVAGGAAYVTVRHLLQTPQPLQSGLPGEAKIDRKHGGDMYYTVLGPRDAEPLVLLHDFYPGASSFEYRHVFPRFATDYRVYAPDWLGFGMSEHPAIAYTGEFYANMLSGFLRDVVERPAAVIAHGHASSVAVRAASDAPELFNRLVLVSPDVSAGADVDPRLSQVLVRLTQRVSLGLVPYAMLSTRPLLRRLAQQRQAQTGGDIATDETVEHLYASTHQFGGHHAPLALLTGELDLPMQHAFALLEPPVLIISGAEDERHPPEEMEDLAILNPHTDLDIINGAGDAVFEDQPAEFTEALRAWLTAERQRHLLTEQDLLASVEALNASLTGEEALAVAELAAELGAQLDAEDAAELAAELAAEEEAERQTELAAELEEQLVEAPAPVEEEETIVILDTPVSEADALAAMAQPDTATLEVDIPLDEATAEPAEAAEPAEDEADLQATMPRAVVTPPAGETATPEAATPEATAPPRPPAATSAQPAPNARAGQPEENPVAARNIVPVLTGEEDTAEAESTRAQANKTPQATPSRGTASGKGKQPASRSTRQSARQGQARTDPGKSGGGQKRSSTGGKRSTGEEGRKRSTKKSGR